MSELDTVNMSQWTNVDALHIRVTANDLKQYDVDVCEEFGAKGWRWAVRQRVELHVTSSLGLDGHGVEGDQPTALLKAWVFLIYEMNRSTPSR